MWSHFTPEALRAIRAAEIEAARMGRLVSPAHLLLGALDNSAAPPGAVPGPNMSRKADPEWKRGEPATDANLAPSAADDAETTAARALRSLNVEPLLLRLALLTRLKAIHPPAEGAIGRYSRAAFNALGRATKEARRTESGKAGTEHLLLSVAGPGGDTLGLGMECLWYLNNRGMVPSAFWESALRQARASYVVVADVLAEFGLDVMILRVAVASCDPNSAIPAWTGEVQRLVERAAKEARTAGAGLVGPEHLWLGLLADSTSAAMALLETTGVPTELLQRHLRASLHADNETAGAKVRYTADARRAFEAADGLAHAARYRCIGSDHLLLALAGAEDPARKNIRQRARSFLAPTPTSRAEAAIAQALQELGLPRDHFQRTLAGAPEQGAPAEASVRHEVKIIVANVLEIPVESIDLNAPWPHAEPAPRARKWSLRPEHDYSLSPEETAAIRTVGDMVETINRKILADRAQAARAAQFSKSVYAIITSPLYVYVALIIGAGAGYVELSGIEKVFWNLLGGCCLALSLVYWKNPRTLRPVAAGAVLITAVLLVGMVEALVR